MPQLHVQNNENEAPNYLLNLIPKTQQTITTWNKNIPNCHCGTNCFKYSFFPYTLKDWFNLNPSIRHSQSLAIFKSRLLSFIRLIQSNIYNIFDPIEWELLTRLRLGCSYLNDIVRTPPPPFERGRVNTFPEGGI